MGTYLRVRLRVTTWECDRTEAEKKLGEVLAKLKEKDDRKAGRVKRTFSETCKLYAMEQRSDATYIITRKLQKHFGPTLLCEDVNQEALRGAYTALLGQNVSDATRKRQVMAPVKAILTLAASEWGAKQGCPVPAFKKIPDAKRRNRILMPHEAEAMISLATERGLHLLACVLVVGVSEGPRRGEFFNLDWKFVDLDRSQMTLRDTKALRGDERDRRIDDLRPRTITALRDLQARTGLTKGPVFRKEDGSTFRDLESFGAAMNSQMKQVAAELKLIDPEKLLCIPCATARRVGSTR